MKEKTVDYWKEKVKATREWKNLEKAAIKEMAKKVRAQHKKR